jgi:hypothetical protein
MTENERLGLVSAITGSINSGKGELADAQHLLAPPKAVQVPVLSKKSFTTTDSDNISVLCHPFIFWFCSRVLVPQHLHPVFLHPCEYRETRLRWQIYQCTHTHTYICTVQRPPPPLHRPMVWPNYFLILIMEETLHNKWAVRETYNRVSNRLSKLYIRIVSSME